MNDEHWYSLDMTDAQREYLIGLGVEEDELEGLSMGDAANMIDELLQSK
jgi:hypothetical protein